MMAGKARGLSQVPYALIAVPFLVLLFTPMGYWGVWLLARLGFHIDQVSTAMIAIQMVCSLLLVALVLAVLARLRHAGWALWLSTPVIMTLCLRLYVSLLALRWFDGDGLTRMPGQLIWVSFAIYLVSLVVIVGLIFVPGGKAPAIA